MAMYIHTAEVLVPAGERFPLDMLRYDACYPSGQDSVTAMILGIDKPEWRIARKVIVHHRSQVNRAPWSVGRWASFGCTLIDKGSRKV